MAGKTAVATTPVTTRKPRRRSTSKISTLAKQKAFENRHTLISVAVSGLAGYLEKSEAKKKKEDRLPLPVVKSLGITGTYGIIALIAGNMMKGNISEYLRHGATGLLSVAAYKFMVKEDKKKVSGVVEVDTPDYDIDLQGIDDFTPPPTVAYNYPPQEDYSDLYNQLNGLNYDPYTE